MTDQNRKTLRSFYCRDYLWEHFEQMAQELGCSMDYLINESMRLYARDRDPSAAEPAGGPARSTSAGAHAGQSPNTPANSPGRAPQQSQPGGVAASPGPGAGAGAGAGDNHRTFQQVPSVGNSGRGQSPPGGPGGAGPSSGPGGPGGAGPSSGPGGPPPPPPRPGNSPSGGGGPAGNPGQPASDNWQQQNQPAAAQSQSPGGGFQNQPGPTAGSQPPLYLSFNGNRYVIDQDKYVIGRGSKHTDLTIRDGNISRKHCAIIYRNGSYYIKDLDSTNGVEYRGSRIESKKIEEGDVFFLCDYELRFSFRG